LATVRIIVNAPSNWRSGEPVSLKALIRSLDLLKSQLALSSRLIWLMRIIEKEGYEREKVRIAED